MRETRCIFALKSVFDEDVLPQSKQAAETPVIWIFQLKIFSYYTVEIIERRKTRELEGGNEMNLKFEFEMN